ncbi:anthranilate/aminodeoxychorismate synthase component II [Pseudoalteromonas rubra]|uniref:Anthranilate/aminodeoxychorismate synthase component II n=1 Tax=Pseudoalteromonas rubra TaxID=43658 RepID=A0A5S3WNH5_9GAMM|nr:aminodeoxychorismate/anthranilate synthase component II [Pseudoalteromonas rubra]TMP29892.1 anthranilate/aminodeoxychorismate synthase component II [Pseudoalteromonas rubra]TMP32120.1 anthranilate/aminodeoxychorismate synthase component II [Pseudoalteromonas rubra]
MLLMIDNYDSFTFNLVQYFQRLDQEVVVHRNDALSVAEIRALNPDHIVISPGPCSPNEAGISLSVVDAFQGQIPILGICLGHQTIAQALGAQVVRAKYVMHGKTSTLVHNDGGSFNGLPERFEVCRYHSLVVQQSGLPDSLEVTAWTQNSAGELDEIMGLCHTERALEGVQFHPEAILTEHGLQLLDNFISRF